MSILQSFIEVYESKQEDEMSLEKYLKIRKKTPRVYKA